jgi:hypothetical protein
MNAMPPGRYLAITHVGRDLISPEQKVKVKVKAESIIRNMSHDQAYGSTYWCAGAAREP